MNERDRRIARARLLRRQGKTYNEIREVLGPVDDKTLLVWCRGIPRPPETRRSRPKVDLRLECRRLRAMGLTYSEIAEATGASQGSISPWVRDIQVPNRERAERRRLDALRAAAKTRSAQAQRRRDVHTASAAASIGPVADRELFLLGVGLYWAEGSKSKSYDTREHITFVNSDPLMIEVFLRWLRLLGVSLGRCRFRVAIHETADVQAAERFWHGWWGFRSTVFAGRPSSDTGRKRTGSILATPIEAA